MGGKSRKTGGVSKKLIERLKRGNLKKKGVIDEKRDGFEIPGSGRKIGDRS